MKTIIPKTLLILLLSLSCKAQVYYLFPTDSAVWTVDFIFPLPFFQLQHNPSAYFISGDSLHNGLTYQKINKTSDSIPNNQLGSYNMAMIREDNQKIYCQYYGFATIPNEFVLYDFTLNLNDTFSLATFQDTVRFIVSSVDSEYTQTGYRQALNLNHISGNLPFGAPAMRWVEGIGDILNGVIYPEVPWVDWWAEGLCYRQNGGLIWSHGGACWVTSIYAEGLHKSASFIKNNPSNSYIEIDLESIQGEKNLLMMDGSGKICKKIRSNSSKIIINKNELESGIYFLQINSNKFSATEKFILL